MEQIDKDVKRTLPEFAFFQLTTPYQSLPPRKLESHRKFFKRLEIVQQAHTTIPTPDEIDTAPSSPSTIMPRPETDQKHWEVMERILFVYSKLNPAVCYVQGMNELLCPLYFVIAHDGDEDSKVNAEADAFFLFTTIMGVFRDHFMRSLDEIQPAHSSIRRFPPSLTNLAIDPLLITQEQVQKRNDSGIGATMKRVMHKLKIVDYGISSFLQLYFDLI